MKKFITITILCVLGCNIMYSQTYTKADYEKECIFTYDLYEDNVLYQFHNGIARVDLFGDYTKTITYINAKGNDITPRLFDSNSRIFSEGYAAIRDRGTWVYINKEGKELNIKSQMPKLIDAGFFSEGLAAVNNDGRYGYINKQGMIVVNPKYEEAYPFSEGLARVKLNGKYGYINKQGALVIPFKYVIAEDFSEGYAAVGINKEEYGFINKQGSIMLPLDSYLRGFIEIAPFKNGYTNVKTKKDKKYIFIDKHGRNAIKPDMREPYDAIYDGLYVFSNNPLGKKGLKKLDGTIILEPTYDDILIYENGYFSVIKGDKWGVIDRNGKLIVPCKYDYIWDMSEDMFVVKIKGKGSVATKDGGKYGFVNNQGREITPIIFDYTHGYHEGFATIAINGKLGYIDKNGKPLKIDFSKRLILDLVEKLQSEAEFNKKAGSMEEAVKWLKRGSKYAECCYSLGTIYYFGTTSINKNYDEAERWLEKAKTLAANSNGHEDDLLSQILNALAYLRAVQKRYTEAQATIDKAISLAPTNANLYDSKGEIYLMMGKDDEALKMWNKVIKQNPNFLVDYPQGTELSNKLKAKGKIK